MTPTQKEFIEMILDTREVGVEVEHAVRVLISEDTLSDVQYRELIELLLHGRETCDRDGRYVVGGIIGESGQAKTPAD